MLQGKQEIKGFYVYIDCKPDGTVFYVGKGCGMRFYKSLRNHNKYWMRIVLKYGSYTRKLIKHNLTEKESFELEKALILKHSKTIVNATCGGEGNSHSDLTKLKISNALKGNTNGKFKKVSEAEKVRIGKWASERVRSSEERLKHSITMTGRVSPLKGRKLSAEHRLKLSISHKKKI